MNISNRITSLDNISTPVIILDSKGKVIYKNWTAMRNIRLPRRGTHIFKHLDNTGKSEYEKLFHRRKPSVITVNTGDRNARAFVSRYIREAEECTVWVFVSHLQANASSKIFNMIEGSINLASVEICEIIKEIDRRALVISDEGSAKMGGKIEKKFVSLLDRIYSRESTDTEITLYEVPSCIDILTLASKRTLSHFGYRVSIGTDNIETGKGALIDYRGFSSAFMHILMFAVEANESRGISIDFDFDGENVIFRSVFTVPIPSFYTNNSSDISLFSDLCPKSAVEALVLEKVLETYGYSFSFDVSEATFDNVSVTVKAPVIESTGLHAPSHIDIESFLVEKDQSVLLAFALLTLVTGSQEEA